MEKRSKNLLFDLVVKVVVWFVFYPLFMMIGLKIINGCSHHTPQPTPAKHYGYDTGGDVPQGGSLEDWHIDTLASTYDTTSLSDKGRQLIWSRGVYYSPKSWTVNANKKAVH